jgi:hypothetical protein
MMSLVLLSMVAVGCGGGASEASETKSISDCTTEAEAMSEDALKETIKSYQEAIKTKKVELAELKAEMIKNGPSEEMTDKATELGDSLNALKERSEIYFMTGAKKFGKL